MLASSLPSSYEMVEEQVHERHSHVIVAEKDD